MPRGKELLLALDFRAIWCSGFEDAGDALLNALLTSTRVVDSTSILSRMMVMNITESASGSFVGVVLRGLKIIVMNTRRVISASHSQSHSDLECYGRTSRQTAGCFTLSR